MTGRAKNSQTAREATVINTDCTTGDTLPIRPAFLGHNFAADTPRTNAADNSYKRHFVENILGEP